MHLFDLHCDTLYRALTENKSILKNDFHLSVERGAEYSPWLQCFAVWIPDELRGKDAFGLFDKAAQKFKREISNSNGIIAACSTKDDIKYLTTNKKCGAILTIEGGAAIAGDLKNIDYMANCGVKIITLTWNGNCEIGDGSAVDRPVGLTEFGRKAIAKMEENEIVVDVSHASDKLFYDVCEVANKPIIATHSNSRTVCNHRRNLTDEQFTMIRDMGGIVGISFCNYFLRGSGIASFSDILKHVEYFLSLGGENTICIGTDFDGTDMPSGINGIESMKDLYEYFLKHNYNEELTKGIFFNNAYGFFTNIL